MPGQTKVFETTYRHISASDNVIDCEQGSLIALCGSDPTLSLLACEAYFTLSHIEH